MTTLNDAETVRNHWWPRPGWRPGRGFYTWHLTFENATELHRLATVYQNHLTGLDGLNLVPLPWLHLTVQGVGWVDETSDALIDAVSGSVGARLRAIPAPDISFNGSVILEESIVLAPTPSEPVHEIRTAIRKGIVDVVGPDRLHTGPEQARGFRPHVSIAYMNADGAALPYRSALADVQPEPAHVHVAAVSLIEQHRILEPEWVYRWTTRAVVPLGDSQQIRSSEAR